MSHTRMTTSAFLLLELSPLLVFEFDFLSLLCNTNTLRNILMILVTLDRVAFNDNGGRIGEGGGRRGHLFFDFLL